MFDSGLQIWTRMNPFWYSRGLWRRDDTQSDQTIEIIMDIVLSPIQALLGPRVQRDLVTG